jgi:carboxyl-terminal processing protease
MSRWNLAWLLGINAVALLGLAITYGAPPQDENKKYARARLFVDVMDEVERNFVRKLSDDELRELVENMINGGLARLDPYSSFINNKKLREFNKHSRGKFGGIGIQIHADRQTGVLTVISPIVGTPAYEAGIQAGDQIFKIDGKSTENMTLEEAVDRITGDKGQPIVLNVLHEGDKKPTDIKIIRDIIEVESVLGDRRKPDNVKQWDYMYDKEYQIAYVRLVAFNENSAGELRAVIERLRDQGVRGLVLDLRFNPGGLLTSAVEVSNLFLPEDSRVVSIRGRNGAERVYNAKKEGTILGSAREVPMAVLVNRSSASASEIVSAALQDHGRAVIIGERSFGKGSVQNVIELENKSSVLKLTTASYWRPSGKNIHRHEGSKETDEWGVKPNEDPSPFRPERVAALAFAPAAPFPAAPTWPGLYLATQKKIPGRFEVNLSDWERYQYQVDRYEKDIVHGKSGHASQKPKSPARKSSREPFRDRVLDRAIEYLRGEIKSRNAPPVLRVVNG